MWFTGRKRNSNAQRSVATQAKTQSPKPPKRKEQKGEEVFQLVEGKFSPIEAADILISLLNDKIRYHQIRALNNELEARLQDYSQKKLERLKAVKERLSQLIREANEQGQLLEIDCKINLVLRDNPELHHGTHHKS